jgi:hypothetical protein
MKKVLILLISLVPFLSWSQLKYGDITGAAGQREGSLSAMYTYAWQFGAKKKFEIGIAGRFTTYLGQNQYYITAPAKLTSGSTGPLVIFQKKYCS